jgi:hypothetical protein
VPDLRRVIKQRSRRRRQGLLRANKDRGNKRLQLSGSGVLFPAASLVGRRTPPTVNVLYFALPSRDWTPAATRRRLSALFYLFFLKHFLNKDLCYFTFKLGCLFRVQPLTLWTCSLAVAARLYKLHFPCFGSSLLVSPELPVCNNGVKFPISNASSLLDSVSDMS